ncbi:phospholipase A1-Ibeta2, chloroplastic-like [Phragmites australis]|uniref:phospholipase A1-Ibeta2, chloroplastic-like n=1 Tax=Phragmites australis TaxID=29695 RepID=UPI002D784CFE|nr:phospholipase A1-Ibeta2, chloroplastic-like [Phragmites australis]
MLCTETQATSCSLDLSLGLALDTDTVTRTRQPPAMSAAATAPPCHSRPSPLNPNARAMPSAGKPNAVSTRTHLANLDRLLVRPLPLLQPKKLPAEEPGDGEATPDDRSGRSGLLNALNLSTFLPFTRKPPVDEMSPRSLAYMQRLLTLSPRPSPKGSIAAEWRRYHGEGGWEGLLDPLDQNLRREILRYGDFVQAAYTAFHSMPAAAAAASHGQHRTLVLPDRSYRPTRSLFASSSLSIPPWAQRRSAPRWLTQRSSFVGYVAVCDNEREVQRMGRRDIAIVLRGTATCPEWAENLRTGLVPLTEDDNASAPKVAKGFLSLYKTAGDHVPSLSDAIVEEVKRLVELYKGEELSITVVGHSLGASLALLAADELSACLSTNTDHRPPPVAVVSFGGPKTGNRAFVDRLQRERGVNVLRVVNAGDVVTRVPAPISREGYVHAGAELRLDSRDSPCLRPDAGLACCHDLEAYLHLLDGFAGSGQPFRADASRSVARLLTYQRPNVKRAYVERAMVLGFETASPRTATANGAGADGQCGYLASPT